MNKTFLIDFVCYGTDNTVIQQGKFKVKNKANELFAKIAFEDYLKRQHKEKFGRPVINSCKEETNIDQFFEGFKDLFKTK